MPLAPVGHKPTFRHTFQRDDELMKSSLLAKFALICSMLAPWLAVAADEVVFRDKAGRVLKKSDLAEANGNFSWELASTTPVSEAAKKEHALGRVAGQRGDHRTALAHFAAASKLAPAWPYPVYDAAFTFLLQKEFDTAYEYYRRVDQMAPRGFFTAKTAVHALRMELNRELPSGTYLSYVALEWEADKQKVRQVAQAMTRETPGFAPAWKTAAMLEDDLGRRAALLESGLKARPDEETRGFLLLNKALVLHEQNKISEAKAILGELALAPTSPARRRGVSETHPCTVGAALATAARGHNRTLQGDLEMSTKKLPLSTLEEAARVATQIALSSFPDLPESLRANLTLGTSWDGDSVVFELYLPQERPAEAIVLTETRLSVYDGHVQAVRVFKDAFMAAVASE